MFHNLNIGRRPCTIAQDSQ